MRASNERSHAAAQSSSSTSSSSGGQYAYTGVDRSRKQDFIDPSVLAECVKKVAAAFQLKTLEPDTIPLIALATRHRLDSLVHDAIAARDHRQRGSHFRTPPLVDARPRPRATTTRSNKRQRRNRDEPPRRDPMTGDLIMDDDEEGEEEEEDEEDEEDEDEREGGGKKEKVPAWDSLVYDDPERYLTVLERVDRAEEAKHRRQRMQRDMHEQRERDQAEEIYAAELARKAIEQDQLESKVSSSSALVEPGTPASGAATTNNSAAAAATDNKGKGKAPKNAADRFLAANQSSFDSSAAPSTPTKELGKDGKPKKKKKAKTADGTPGGGGPATPAGAAGASHSGTSTPSATSIAKNMSEDVSKRLTDSSAMKFLGGTKYSWMNAGGAGSPSPLAAAQQGGGVSSLLGKPKFAPASSIGAAAGAGGVNASSSSSSVELANALTTSRLNVPVLHDAQRTQIAKDQWEAGHRVVELGDLLFAIDRERGAGVGKGAGRNAALRGRAGITRGGYRTVGTGR